MKQWLLILEDQHEDEAEVIKVLTPIVVQAIDEFDAMRVAEFIAGKLGLNPSAVQAHRIPPTA